MLGPGRYLLGVAELVALVGFAWLGASSSRRRLAPGLDGLTGHLASGVVAAAILLWVAELLGSVGLFEAVPYLLTVVVVGGGTWAAGRRAPREPLSPAGPVAAGDPPPLPVAKASSGVVPPTAPPAGEAAGEGRRWTVDLPAAVALAIALAAVIRFAMGVKLRLSTGMTGFDSTWYHGPFAAGFFRSGNTWSLHFIAPQFLAWFYPANSEVAHAVGMLAFGRDLLSPLLNLGWFVGCLVAAWCIGRPYRVAPWSLALAAVALSVPALHDQAGEARNDIVGIFFLLAAVAMLVAPRERSSPSAGGAVFALGPVALVGLSAGLAAGTKLNFLLPAAALVGGVALIAPRARRRRAFAAATLGALAAGGYWYLRDLAHTGNPLPWVKHLGPITLPAPDQALGGREGHSVSGYLTDGSVWSDWFLPGLHHGLTFLWPLLAALALAGLLLCVVPWFRCAFSGYRQEKAHRNGEGALAIAGLAGLAAILTWLIAPTSASGPAGMPHGFESGLRYLAPALILGLALLPTAPAVRDRLSLQRSHFPPHDGRKYDRTAVGGGMRWGLGLGLATAILIVVAIGYPIQRHYLRNRYADPTFSAPGLNVAFAWAQGIDDARIATTSTRQYPLFGRDLSNEVQYIGEERPHGGFTAPTTCRAWRQLLNAGHYDYVVTSRDRLEPGKPSYPPASNWTQAPNAHVVLKKPPTIIYKLNGPLRPSSCPS